VCCQPEDERASPRQFDEIAARCIDLMKRSRTEALEILRQNVGFEDPEPWVDYALRHSFKRSHATPIPLCPDCGQPPVGQLGQYVHYSTLIRILTCGSCHLIWANARLDPSTVREHFEAAYKDRNYFRQRRASIFRQLLGELERLTPHGGAVLDIGGAQGDLMHLLKIERPDVTTVVHDLSESAVQYAREHFGLPTILGDVGVLQRHDRRYDAVVLSDVLYYEPRIADVWGVLRGLVAPGGAVLLRVPNKLAVIRVHQVLYRLMRSLRRHNSQDSIRYFNPEHIYILSRRYLTARLLRTGFRAVRVLPSPPFAAQASVAHRAIAALVARSSDAISVLSRRTLVSSPSMLVIGSAFGAAWNL
jgi:2-polyprenyl-3-methyl-5-hydroxy-6-metoxy-1,4-benzoquinol methylase